jgi:hypothetical protein
MKSILEKNKGKSFAEVAKSIEKQYPDREFDPLQRRSYETAMTTLIKHQEQKKTLETMKQAQKMMKNGGKLEYKNGGKLKYQGGGPLMQTLMAQLLQKSGGNPANILKQDAQNLQTDLLKPQERQFDLQTSQAELKSSFGDQLSNALSKAGTKIKDFVQNDADAPAMIGKGVEMIGNLGMLAGGPDQESPAYNPYEEDVRRTMEGRSVDSTAQRNAILEARNRALGNNSNYARSKNVQTALNQNIEATTGDQVAQSLLQQDQINEGFAGQLAATLNQLGGQRVQAETFTNELNARNKGNYQTQVSRFLSDISGTGMDLTAQKYNQQMNNLMTEILNNKYADFGVNPEIMQKALDGTATPEELQKLGQLFQLKAKEQ